MSATDPRSSIKSLLDAQITSGNLTRDDDSTLLKWHVLYGPYDMHLNRLFTEKGIDLLFILDDAVSVETVLGIGHRGLYPVTPYAIDKRVAGTKIITATLVLWKAVQELRSVFLANPWGSLRSLTEEEVKVHTFGHTQIWSKPCRIEYKTYST